VVPCLWILCGVASEAATQPHKTLARFHDPVVLSASHLEGVPDHRTGRNLDAPMFPVGRRPASGQPEVPMRTTLLVQALCVALLLATVAARAQSPAIDLAGVSTSVPGLRRVYGSGGDGTHGVPVAGGLDCDGDGHPDYAMAAMLASPLGRTGAGRVYLVFGDGTIQGTLDTSTVQAGVLRIDGDGPSEATGSEIWMADVTGDGIADLLIGRQNYTPDGSRTGAGALTIVVGGPALRSRASALQDLDLRSPPAGVTIATMIGARAFDRLGIWMRTGDVTGDGVDDIVVGADQQEIAGDTHAGSVYLVRGGPHLAANQTIDLASFGSRALPGNLARLHPPLGSLHYHFGATCQVADLDANGRDEVLAAAALNRVGASILADGAPAGSAHAVGGSVHGTLYVAWDDNFSAGPWPDGLDIDVSSPPGTVSVIDGGADDGSFGEELAGGPDYDGDGTADLFVGDLVGDASPDGNRPNSGTGYLFYDAAALKGLSFSLNSPPSEATITTMIGGGSNYIAGDTVAQGDFDGDGKPDLAVCSPEGSPFGRSEAGIIDVFYGRNGRLPPSIDLKAGSLPPPGTARIAEIYGAHGAGPGDRGDVLCYSSAAADVDGDGRDDLIVNEMLGNGPGGFPRDKGNLVIISGALLTPPSALSGRVSYYRGNRPVGGVVLDLDAPQSAATAGTGRYAFADAPAGASRLEPSKIGGINGAISSLDASWILQTAVGLRQFDSMQKLACDVTGNGTISSLDAARILQYQVHLLERFTVADSCSSDWLFVPEPDSTPNQMLTQPQAMADSCRPGAISYDPFMPPAENQNFVAVLFGDCTGNWAP
jgi:hypothetical protein